ncbi:uncharacterized protein V1516DRAFT_682544 [Lipomyces oligophaga]|uniref:uncharacterized protein n=1 Tax=Lipomyces oligophaga TaxID=45792 RepID=UPI0034CD7F0E
MSAHQKVILDVDLSSGKIKGSTEITVVPSEQSLRSVRLNFRQAKVAAIYINNKPALWDYEDYWASTSSEKFLDSARSVYQFEAFQDKLSSLTGESLIGELVIHFPRGFKVQAQDSFVPQISVRQLSPVVSRHGSPDAQSHPTFKPDINSSFVPINVRIEFELDNPVMGLKFVKATKEHRYPHVYTCSNPFGVSTSSWLPCVDGLWERCSWEFEITVPKTIADIKKSQIDIITNGHSAGGTLRNTIDDEDAEQDISVVCIGDMQREITHPTDHAKKIVSFLMLSPISAQHVAFAVGPFIPTNLSELKDSDDDDPVHSTSSSSEVVAYALPGRQEEVVNTCMFMTKAMEYFVREYASYPFNSFFLCFVENAEIDMEPSAGLAVISDSHLFPQDVIDPLFTVTKYLTTLLAAQWSGVNITPKYWSSLCITTGICRYISGMFLRKLMGNNEYRFRLRKDIEKICELDIGRPPIGASEFLFPLDKATLKFIELKAPVVLHILDRRLTKGGGSFGLTRVIPKLFRQAMMGELTNLSISHFQRLCEKVSHVKVDAFFQEWIYGSGYPIFRITQRFNKKKMFVEMGIRQVQNAEMPSAGSLHEEDFIKQAKKQIEHPEDSQQQLARTVFTGPMTIRIHEADGTPYEHVVNIKDSFTKLDIQYNTKYKRLRRHLRQREKGSGSSAVASAASAAIAGEADDELDGVLLHSLGDVLSSDLDMEEWRLSEWTKEEEDSMTNEAFEWMRVDSDFEWICVIYINQPDYMYASQLQQDRDVVAQYECIRYFSDAKPNPIYSTLLVRTLMDRRYYYGIRVEAALALSKYATPELDWVGQHHLLKAFQTIFCFPDSLIPQANDFSDVPTYLLQKAIPKSLSEIKNDDGQTPLAIKEFLLDLLRYNENSHNLYSDCYYVGTLMESIANSISKPAEEAPEYNFEFSFEVPAGTTETWTNTSKKSSEKQFVEKAMTEIERCRNMDTWMPSFQNTISTVAIQILEKLARVGVVEASITELIPFTHPDRFFGLRLAAFSALLSIPDMYKSESHRGALLYVFRTAEQDVSLQIRLGIIRLLGESVAKISMHKFGRNTTGDVGTFMIVEETGGEVAESRKEELRRSNLTGCIEIAQEQFANAETFKRGLWELLSSCNLGVLEKRMVGDICEVLYESRPCRIVKWRIPDGKRVYAKNLGQGRVIFYRSK